MRQTRYDSIPLSEGDRLARFVDGVAEPYTPAAAYAEWTAGEGESVAAARQRMIERYTRGGHSKTAAEGREKMIRRQSDNHK